MTDYIPLQDFADRVGISRQAVSKNKQLAPYIRDTRPKTISTEALSLFGTEEPCTVSEESNPNPEESNATATVATEPQPNCNPSATQTQPYETLSATLAYLQSQLAEKDRIIAEKDAQIADLTKKISTIAEKSHDIAEKSVVALQQRNFLEAQSQLPPPEKKTIFSWFKKRT